MLQGVYFYVPVCHERQTQGRHFTLTLLKRSLITQRFASVGKKFDLGLIAFNLFEFQEFLFLSLCNNNLISRLLIFNQKRERVLFLIFVF